MRHGDVSVEIEGNVAEIEIHRPPHNFFDVQLIRDLADAFGAVDAVSTLTKIQAPTLVVVGRDDRVTPMEGALAAMRLIRQCELHVLYDCGHWAMIERKDEFESTVLAFLARDRKG